MNYIQKLPYAADVYAPIIIRFQRRHILRCACMQWVSGNNF